MPRNRFHVVGLALWVCWLVLGLLAVGVDATAYWLAPFWLLLLLTGGAVLVSGYLRRR